MFRSMLTGSLQGIAERPLPCIYNEIRMNFAFTAVTRVQIPPGTPFTSNNLRTDALFPAGTKRNNFHWARPAFCFWGARRLLGFRSLLKKPNDSALCLPFR